MAITDSEIAPSSSTRALSIAIRVDSWVLAIGALLAVISAFETLPDKLPISRWHSANKTWLLALRVPLINLLCLGLIEVLGRSLSRYRGHSNVIWISPVLAATAGTKALIESIELLQLPKRLSIFPILVVAAVLAGVTLSLWCGRHLLKDANWKELKSTFSEKIALALLVAAMIGLNVPLFVR